MLQRQNSVAATKFSIKFSCSHDEFVAATCCCDVLHRFVAPCVPALKGLLTFAKPKQPVGKQITMHNHSIPEPPVEIGRAFRVCSTAHHTDYMNVSMYVYNGVSYNIM